jgi:hypothetical protein
MMKTFDILPPKTIVDRFKQISPNQKPKPVANALWDSFSTETIAVMTNSCPLPGDAVAKCVERRCGLGEPRIDGTLSKERPNFQIQRQILSGILHAFHDQEILVNQLS